MHPESLPASFPIGPVSRRTVLGAGALATAGAVVGTQIGAAPARAAAPADFVRIRTQWRGTLIGGDLTDSVVRAYVATAASEAEDIWDDLVTVPSRTYLWADLPSPTDSAMLRATAGRLRILALALSTPGSTLYDDATLRSQLISAFDWFLANRYGVTERPGNWWDFVIGIPIALNDFCVLLFDSLSTAQIATAMAAIKRYAPDPRQTGPVVATGANLTWAVAVAIVRGALSQDEATIADAKNAAIPVFDYATGGDGFYPDGGFIQHERYSYNGGYAVSLLQYLTYSMVATAGTPWAFTPARITTLHRWVQENYAPWIFDGAFMDMTRGRGLSRFYETDHRTGRLTIATLLQFAAVLPAAQALALRSRCKGWITRNSFLDFFTYDSAPIEQVRISSVAAGRSVMTNPSIPAGAEEVSTLVAPSMARALYRRPGFAVGIAMATTEVRSAEMVNSENAKGWYTGEGAMYLYLPAQDGHWANHYWPTADKTRLPGTTVDTRTPADGAPRYSTNTWAGGAILDGTAAFGTSLKSNQETLIGRKSWFCLDDAIVCLGAGISSGDGAAIETIMENRNIGPNGQTVPVADGAQILTGVSSTPTTIDANWVWVPGLGGYVFPTRTRLRGLREDRTGRWTDMDKRGVYPDNQPYTRRFVTLWFDHGVNPSAATYAYVQLPGATQAETSGRAAALDVAIVANSSDVQAITRSSSARGTTMANFWAAAGGAVAGTSVTQRCSVVVARDGDELAISACDPTQRVTGSITVTHDRAATGVVSVDPGVSVVSLSPKIVLTVAVSGLAGASRAARFRI